MDNDAYILIVDDEQNIINAISRQLRSRRYKCLGTTSGREALEILADNEVAVIICDQKMPEMSGPEVLREAIRISPDTERVTVTGYSDIQMTVDAINIGQTSRFLFKPFSEDSIVGVVEDCYRQYNLKKENKQLLLLKEEQSRKIKELSERLIQHSKDNRSIMEESWMLQNSLLLGNPPSDIRNVQIASETLPAKTLDGDFVFFHRYSETEFDLVVGDVMGKGLFAALTAASLRGYFMREWGRAEVIGTAAHTPQAIIQSIIDSIEERLVSFNLFVSLFFIRFDIEKMKVTYVDAGGVKPLIYRSNTDRVEAIEGDNCPLGIPEGGALTQEERAVADGDVIIFYSDGVLEESSDKTDELFGVDRIEDCLSRSHDLDSHIIISTLFKDITAFRGLSSQSDDLTCVVIKLGEYNSCMLDSSTGVLYRSVNNEMLSSYAELDRLHSYLNEAFKYSTAIDKNRQESIVLAVHEAFVNIIKHSYGGDQSKPVWLDIVCYSDRLEVVLYDYGVSYDREDSINVDFSGNKTSGFGLYIIDEIADEIDYKVDNNARNSLRLIFKK